MTTMKAVRIEVCGDVDVLQFGDYPMPEMGEHDLLVKVMSTAVSGWDIKYRNGSLMKKAQNRSILPGRKAYPLPQQLGREAAGEVIAVGKQVTLFTPGDRVLGLVHPEKIGDLDAIRGFGNLSKGLDYPGHVMAGGNAQFVSRLENYWFKLPDSVRYEDAAASAWSYPTSHRIIVDRCRVAIGDTILITGATGGMGNAAMQWAKLAGARVIAASRSEAKRKALLNSGAELVIDSTLPEKACQQVMDFTHQQGVEHVIEFTGNEVLEKLAYDVLRLGGGICPVGGDMSHQGIP